VPEDAVESNSSRVQRKPSDSAVMFCRFSGYCRNFGASEGNDLIQQNISQIRDFSHLTGFMSNSCIQMLIKKYR
jgi:hypothetical protein